MTRDVRVRELVCSASPRCAQQAFWPRHSPTPPDPTTRRPPRRVDALDETRSGADLSDSPRSCWVVDSGEVITSVGAPRLGKHGERIPRPKPESGAISNRDSACRGRRQGHRLRNWSARMMLITSRASRQDPAGSTGVLRRSRIHCGQGNRSGEKGRTSVATRSFSGGAGWLPVVDGRLAHGAATVTL